MRMSNKIIFIFILLLLFGCQSIPVEKQKVLAKESLIIATVYRDYSQTMDISRNPEKYHEINPILGEHPSKNKIRSFFLFRGISHALVSYFLDEKYADVWQISFFLPSLYLTGHHNEKVGLRNDLDLNVYVKKTWNF